VPAPGRRGAADERHRAGRERARLDEAQVDPVGEQPGACAEGDGVDDEPVLVDDAGPDERPGEPGATVDEDGPASSSRSRATSAAASPRTMRDPLQSARARVEENTTFGISFIGAANRSSEVGQWPAIAS
jgi:hypothetical protein